MDAPNFPGQRLMTTLNLPADRLAIVEAHLPFARRLVRRTLPRLRGLDIDIAVQEATIGLAMAARHFEESRGVPFTHYAFSPSRFRLLRWYANERRRGLRFAPVNRVSVLSASQDPDEEHGRSIDVAHLVDPRSRRQPRHVPDVEALLGSLSQLDRRIIEARYLDGMTAKEAGESLGLSPATVRYRTDRALQDLRDSHARAVDA
jgi:RNA polymerase sigma factor (sigma-70 family)